MAKKKIKESRQQEKVKKQRKKSTKWTNQDYKRYLSFISGNRQTLSDTLFDGIIFQKMAQYIGSKIFQECYTLHFQMKSKYKSIQNIIQNLTKSLHIEPQEVETEGQKLMNLNLSHFKELKTLVQDQLLLDKLMNMKQNQNILFKVLCYPHPKDQALMIKQQKINND